METGRERGNTSGIGITQKPVTRGRDRARCEAEARKVRGKKSIVDQMRKKVKRRLQGLK